MSVSKHTAYNLAGAVIPLILSFVTVPAYLHLIGPDRYGVLAIAWLLLGYFGLFDLGLGRATSFRIASSKDSDPAEQADVFRTALTINAGIGALGGVILWGAGYWFFGSIFKVSAPLRAEMIAALPWLAASVPVATMTGVLTGALQGREKFLKTNTVSVISTILFQIFPLSVAFFVGPQMVGLLAAAVMARVAAIIVLWWMCHGEFTRGQRPTFRREQAGSLLSFGGWVTLNGLMWPMLIMADRFAIGAILGARAVAVYTIPFQLAQRSGIVPNAVSNALFPRMSAVSPEQRLAILDKAIRAMAAILTVPVFVAFFVFKPFLLLWVGADMANASYEIGKIIIFGFWANSFVAIYFTFYQSDGRPAVVTKILAVQVVPYLPLLWLALHKWGLEGAAWLFVARAVISFVPLFVSKKPTRKTVIFISSAGASLTVGFLLSNAALAGGVAAILVAAALLVILSAMSAQCLLAEFPDVARRLPIFGNRLPHVSASVGD